MDEEFIYKLIQNGESETVEFKSRVPSDSIVAANIVSFANTKGGNILIGIGDKKKIIGISNATEVSKKIERISRDIVDPPISIDLKIQKINAKEILIVTIPQSKNPPHFAQGRAFHRFVSNNQLLTSKFITHLTDVAKSGLNPMRNIEAQLSILINTNEDLNKKIEEANSWKIKLKDIMIGAIIGAIISQILIRIL